MGSWSFLLTYRALAHEYLDLGTWHGFQEIRLKEPSPYKKLSFDLSLDPESYLIVFYASSGDTLHGIRLSTHPAFPSACLDVLEQEFVKKMVFTGEIKARTWHHVKLEKGMNGLTLHVDEKPIHIIASEDKGFNIIGFRGSSASRIDNIQAYNNSSDLIFEEDFNRTYRHLILFAFLFMLANGIYLIARRFRTALLIIGIQFAAIFITLAFYFGFIGQHQYPKEWMIHWGNRSSTIEAADTLSDNILAHHILSPADTGVRILFLGTSQTWGAGAIDDEHTFVHLIEEKLQDITPSSRCINAGISGLRSADILHYYQHKWIDLRAHIVVVNLALNDGDSPDYQNNLEELIRINEEKGLQTIFVLEPVFLPPGAYLDNHTTMLEVASKHRILCIDMQRLISERLDDGFLYWDFIHLTNFGQRLFAEALLPHLQAAIAQQANGNHDAIINQQRKE